SPDDTPSDGDPADDEPTGDPSAPDPDDPSPVTSVQTLAVNFDERVEGYTALAFAGMGTAKDPAEGFLDSDAWAFTGLSDGDLVFGDEADAGDYARGTSAGGTSTGGVYAFEVAQSNVALGVQPTGTDFAPGSIMTRLGIEAETPETFSLEFAFWHYNDADRATQVALSVSNGGSEWVELPGSTLVTPEQADAEPAWTRVDASHELDLSSLGLTRDSALHVRWEISDAGGSGGRDEIAIDDITIEVTGTGSESP
ncbi:MAG: hypothetical protein ACOC1U_02620, partial [Spirochaetota bacterium]